jgi:hypothetical protein
MTFSHEQTGTRQPREDQPAQGPVSQSEFAGMVKSARTRLADAQNKSLDPDSQFDLAYDAAHRLTLAALRHQGYRSEHRITFFRPLFIPLVRTMLTCKFF